MFRVAKFGKIFALALGLLAGAWGSEAQAFPLRVLVEGPKSAMVIAVSQTTEFHRTDGTVTTLQPGQFFTVSAQSLGSVQMGENGMVMVGNRWYPETMSFVWLKGGVAALNNVDSETYLRGVIPREMPEEYHPEALKAQAIAARTYALTSYQRRKHGPNYDMVDTTNDQVYGGFAKFNPRTGRSSWLTDPRTDRAVSDTRNIVLNYSKVDGEYRDQGINGWARYGQYALPIRKGPILSQTVSQKMALAGWNFQQILWYWYQSELYRLPQTM